jgi:hypothetical protein
MRGLADLGAAIASVTIGVWLLVAPQVIGLEGPARLSHLVVGPIAASCAVISLSPVTRLVIRANLLFGAWLVVAALLLDHAGWGIKSLTAGAALFVLALIPRSQAERFGGGWGSLWRSPRRSTPPHVANESGGDRS